MKMLLMASVMLSTMFMTSTSPVTLMVYILSQALLTCLMMWFKTNLSWFSYILFLIFLGGLMVLFIYITSLASNEKIFMNLITTYAAVSISFLALGLMLLSSINYYQHKEEKISMIKTFIYMYSWETASLVVATMIYLLLTLLIVVKISNKFNSPIKNTSF